MNWRFVIAVCVLAGCSSESEPWPEETTGGESAPAPEAAPAAGGSVEPAAPPAQQPAKPEPATPAPPQPSAAAAEAPAGAAPRASAAPAATPATPQPSATPAAATKPATPAKPREQAAQPSAASPPTPAAAAPAPTPNASPPSAAPTPAAQTSGRVVVELKNLESDDGQIQAAIFRTAAGFPDDPKKAAMRKQVKIHKRSVDLAFENVPPGTIAVLVHHDENGDSKMQTGMFGMPAEGYGVSRDAPANFGPPSFNDARLTLAPGETKRVVIKMRY